VYFLPVSSLFLTWEMVVPYASERKPEHGCEPNKRK
jgi:hypothetical protein